MDFAGAESPDTFSGKAEVTVECEHLQGPPARGEACAPGAVCPAQTELGVFQPSLRMTLRVVALVSGLTIYITECFFHLSLIKWSLSMYSQSQIKLGY